MCPRGTFIVPSFDEIWPQPGKERSSKARARMGYDYILEAMQHHGLGHLPQPDNFTTCGRSPNTWTTSALKKSIEKSMVISH